MKTVRLFVAGLVAIVAAASCQKENASVSAPETQMVTVSFVANADDGAKASVDGLKMQWSAGDVIGVAEATKGSTIYPFVTEQGGASAVFKGQLPAGFKAGKAIYPFIADVTVNSSADNFQVVGTPSNNQVAVLNNIPMGQNNMWARFDDIAAGAITFHHASAFMKVNVKGSDIASIKLETKSTDAKDEKLKGALTLPADAKANVSTKNGVSSSSSGVKNVTLKSSDGSALASGSYYVTILATDVNERVLTDLTITYTKTDGSKYARSTANSITIVPGTVYALPGTEEDCEKLPDGPLEIKDAADMQSFVANIASYKATDVVTIENDIDLTGVSALSNEGTFLGTLDGKDHSLKNWNCEKYIVKVIGLGATVKNVVIDKTCAVTVMTANSMGIFAYENRGTLSGCVNNADITFSPSQAEKTSLHEGVFLGVNRNLLENCTNNGNVTITAEKAVGQIRYGGIVGSNAENEDMAKSGVYPIVRNCVNNGNIAFTQAGGTNAKDKYIAGIVAVADSYDESGIENCINNGKISADGAESETALFPGGLCGLLKGGIIKNCKNFGEVSSNSTVATAGGLISCVKFGKPVSGIMTSLEGCAVNCKVTGAAATSGMVLGGMTTASDKFVFGTSDAPVKVSGTINGTTVSAGNLDACRVGSSVNVDGTDRVIHAVYEVVTKQ